MSNRYPRRRFLQSTLAATAAGSSPRFPLAARCSPAGELKPELDRIQFDADLEQIVRLIEDTPRDRCTAGLVDQLHRGLPYRRFLAGAFLAAIRRQQSHHSVYLVNSAHQLSQDLPGSERLLPLFWAVDHLKWQQERKPSPALKVLTGTLPAPEKAARELDEAVRGGDTERAERAAAALVRSVGPRQAFEPFWHFGCRDGSLIGHRAISVTSCWRALESIGWRHAEPVLRFVIGDLHTRNGGADRFCEANGGRIDRVWEKLPAGWVGGKADRGASLELFALLRQGRSDEACDLAVRQLSGGVGTPALWDALHLAAAELLILHEPAIGMAGRPLHLNTAVNALHFAFDTSLNPRVRLLILLQAAAWVGEFIQTHLGEGKLADRTLVELGGGQPPAGPGAVEEIFERLPARTFDSNVPGGYSLVDRPDRAEHARTVYALLNRDPDAAPAYAQQARRWLCAKAAVEAHEFKLPAALFEDCDRLSPEWRPRFLAASAHWLHGKQSPESPVLQQAREALRALGER